MAENLRDIIQALAETNDIKYSLVCTVLAIDKEANTVDVQPLDDSAELVDIRLQAQTGSGLLIYPQVASTVVVSFLNKDDGYVSLFSEVESYSFKTETDSLKTIITDLVQQIIELKVTTNSGASLQVINQPQFESIKNRVDKFFNK